MPSGKRLTDGIRLLSRPIRAGSGELWKLVCLSLVCSPLLCQVLRADTSDDGSLQEVIVTATKRETKLLDTPISMTVIGPELLQLAHVDSFADYAPLVPGLTAIDSGPGEKRYALRGLQSAGEPEVALYYDEIPISGLPGASLDTGDDAPDLKLWDVDRIEVLYGPQGTLYGNGSMGGAIRIISKRPDLTSFAAATEAEGGVTNGGAPSWGVSGMANLPLIPDRLAVRMTLYDRHQGGWIDDIERSDIALPQPTGRDLNWEHTWGSRLSATLKASDRWSITSIFYYQRLETGDSFATYPSFGLPDDRYVSAAFVRTPWYDQSAMADLISTYDLGWANLVTTGSYQNRVADQSLDTTRYLLSLYGCTPFTWNRTCTGPPLVPAVSYAHEGVMASSGEVRLVSQTPGRLQWTAGAFMQRASTYHHGQVAVADADGYIDINPTTGIADNRLFARTNYDQFNQYASFAEGTYDVYRGLDATIGLRWFHSYRSDQQIIEQQFFPGEPVGAEPFQQFSESALFKKFQLAKKVTPRLLLYLEAAQGFRAGGPNYPGGFTQTAPPYRSDSVWDYEIGWKSSDENNRFTFTGAVFRINWSHLQQLVPNSLFSYIVNAGSARSDGFESALHLHMWDRWQFDLGGASANAHLVGPQPQSSDPSMQLYEGERLGGVPKWTANAGVVYSTPLADGLTLKSRVDYSYQSSRPSLTSTQSPGYFIIGASNQTSLHLLLEGRDNWTLGLHVNNVFNVFVPLSGQAADSNLINTITAAPPRTVTLTLDKRF
jgi:iron complex outermembrane recepter protein